MKRILVILCACLALTACQEDLEDNTPSVQGIKDGNELWRASGYGITIGGAGEVTIQGSSGDTSLVIVLPSLQVGTFVLSSSSSARINFNDGLILYSTRNDGVGSPVLRSDGQVVVQRIDGNRLSATFRFNAFDASGQFTVNFIDGVVFQVPF